jgi:hypothetical protein
MATNHRWLLILRQVHLERRQRPDGEKWPRGQSRAAVSREAPPVRLRKLRRETDRRLRATSFRRSFAAGELAARPVPGTLAESQSEKGTVAIDEGCRPIVGIISLSESSSHGHQKLSD